MKSSQNRVFVIEDDASMRNALKNLLRSVGIEAELFASANDFLDADRPDIPSCLILDVRLPGMGGLDLQRELAAANIQIPIIFITAHGDIPMSVRAMKAGAVEFLTKPFRDQDLLDAIQVALSQDRVKRQRAGEVADLRKRLELLTARERELLSLVISGRSNKHIAADVGTSEITVKVHRRRLMQKMQATSFADLLRMCSELKIPYTKP
jgi:FixJ family two-component response regulator